MSAIDGASLSYWKSTPETVRNQARAIIAEVVEANSEELVARFYEAFLNHKDAVTFLSHAVVHERLARSLQKWLLELISTNPLCDMRKFNAHQVKIGEVHARLQIPNHLVLEGAGLLKSGIAEQIIAKPLPARQMAATILLLSELIDYAMRVMSEAYVDDTRRQAHVDEAFRMFTLGQDLSLERERQRAAVMQWSQDVLFGIIGGQRDFSTRLLTNSPFGLWIRHRGALLFQGSALLENIEKIIKHVDEVFLPRLLEGSADAPTLMQELQNDINEIQYVLSDLFQMATTIENGRDPLTRTFNRRFLPSVLGREIHMSQANSKPLCVMMIDVDHFKGINDQHGHSAGDVVLGHVAELITKSVRNSDFVFRYGGEEFLVVLIETDLDEAQRLAEGMRARFAQEPLRISDDHVIRATISIGIASFDGHPDYEVMINAADKALYMAKNRGRNQVAIAASAHEEMSA